MKIYCMSAMNNTKMGWDGCYQCGWDDSLRITCLICKNEYCGCTPFHKDVCSGCFLRKMNEVELDALYEKVLERWEVCKSVVYGGKCQYGNRCRFKHE